MKIYRIGRDPTNDVVIDDETVSRVHAELRESEGDDFHVVDLKSTYGTGVLREGHWVQIHESQVMRDEPIRFGDFESTVAEIVGAVGVRILAAKPRRKRTATGFAEPLSPRLKLYGGVAAALLAIAALLALWLTPGDDSEQRFIAACIGRQMPSDACKCAGNALSRKLSQDEFAEFTDHFHDLTRPSLELLPKLPVIFQSMSGCGLKTL